MKRMMFKFSVALLTFGLGIAATYFYFPRNTPTVDVQRARQIESRSFPTCFPGRSVEVGAIKPKPSSYFTQGTFSENEWLSRFRIDWYSEHLQAMGEPSLLSNIEGESYRFLWLRSFHYPIVVRVWHSGDKFSLSVKQLSGAGGYKPGELLIDQTRPLTEAEWNEFACLLENSCYWLMPVNEERGMSDGAQWILEGVKDNRYHVVDRQSPEGGKYRDACLFLLKISGLKVPDKDVY